MNGFGQMRKIIIHYDEALRPEEALNLVRKVVAQGRVSEAGGIRHFCWVTVSKVQDVFGISYKYVVQTLRKKPNQLADSFKVTLENE